MMFFLNIPCSPIGIWESSLVASIQKRNIITVKANEIGYWPIIETSNWLYLMKTLGRIVNISLLKGIMI